MGEKQYCINDGLLNVAPVLLSFRWTFLQNSFTVFWNETFQLLHLPTTPILPLTAIKATESPVQYWLFHKALLWNCHFSMRVSLRLYVTDKDWDRPKRRREKDPRKDIKTDRVRCKEEMKGGGRERSQAGTVCSASEHGDTRPVLCKRWIPIYGLQLSLHKTSIIQR